MNKKVKECENIEFLPNEYRNRTDLNQAEKNVLATLCYYYLRYSDYAAEHNGWFFASGKEMGAESGTDERTVYRILVKLELKGLVKRKSGTNHKCTDYKLNPKITELMPKSEDFEEPENEGFEEPVKSSFTDSKDANVTLVKKRLVESSKEQTRRDETSLFSNKKNNKINEEFCEQEVKRPALYDDGLPF